MQDVARELKNDIINNLHGPLQFDVEPLLVSWHGFDHTGLSPENFMIAFNLVVTTLDAGYYPTRKTPLVGAQDWAVLMSVALAAVG